MNKKKGFISLLIFGISILILTIERYVFFGIWDKPIYVSFIICLCVYFIASYILYNTFRSINPFFLYSLIFLPPFLLLMLVLSDEELKFRVPSIFPGETLLISMGIFIGYFIYRKKSLLSIVICLLSLIFIYLYYTKVTIPSLFASSIETQSFNYSKDLNYGSLKQDSPVVNDFNKLKNKVLVFEFWFKDCKPCHQKAETQEILINRFKSEKNVIFFYVNAGNIDKYSTYLNFISNNLYNNIINLYDSAGLFSKQFNVQGYPTEIILYKGRVKRKLVGWTFDTEKKYLFDTEKLLKSILNE